MTIFTKKLLDAVLVTGAGIGFDCNEAKRTFQAFVDGTGAVTATVQVEVSNDNIHWCETEAGEIELAGTSTSSDGFTIDAPWRFARGNVTAISGTGAAVTLLMGS